MPSPQITLLNAQEIQTIHQAALQILQRTGVTVSHPAVYQRLLDAGAVSDQPYRLYFSEEMAEAALQQATKRYTLYGRDPQKAVTFGAAAPTLMSSPGQFAWFDHHTEQRRTTHLADTRAAARLGDALPEVGIVGALSAPQEIPQEIRDVALTIELLRHTTKPVRAFGISRRSSAYVLEVMAAVAGGKDALRQRPMGEMLLNPISPLQFPESELEILWEYLDWGQPVCIAPMPMASSSAPATLAGVMTMAHAEFLAGLIITQNLAPGAAVMYGCIPHILDPRHAICSFGSPEQGLMALGMVEIGRYFGFPIYVNINLTDAKRLDAQTGAEKMASLLPGVLAGAEMLGYAGIVGTDHGANLAWLVLDNDLLSFAKRIQRGFALDAEHLGLDVVNAVGPGGNFLTERHTRDHFRKEFWMPGALWTRMPYDLWLESGGDDLARRAADVVDRLLASHQAPPLEPELELELQRILAACKRQLLP